jgi:hypothetical protein
VGELKGTKIPSSSLLINELRACCIVPCQSYHERGERRERERREKGEGGRNLDFNALLIPL